MQKYFNVSGICVPEKHYMVDILPKIEKITEEYIEPGYYFAINSGHLCGKSTTLYLLLKHLQTRYFVIGVTFIHIAYRMFDSEEDFIREFAEVVSLSLEDEKLESVFMEDWDLYDESNLTFEKLFDKFRQIYAHADQEIVLTIHGIDERADNPHFLKFLEILQNKDNKKIFHSVILFGIYELENSKLLNIAENMFFSTKQIASMLKEYEEDHNFGIDIEKMSNEIYAYTSGYPYLVSQICKLLDEKIWKNEEFSDKSSAWCPEGIDSAVNKILEKGSKDILFYNLNRDLYLYPDLSNMFRSIILDGKSYPFTLTDKTVKKGSMMGYLKEKDRKVAVANRIFEMHLLEFYRLYG